MCDILHRHSAERFKRKSARNSSKNFKERGNCSMFQAGVHVGKGKDKHPVLYITTQYEDAMVPVAKNVAKLLICQKLYQNITTICQESTGRTSSYPSILAKERLRWYLKDECYKCSVTRKSTRKTFKYPKKTSFSSDKENCCNLTKWATQAKAMPPVQQEQKAY